MVVLRKTGLNYLHVLTVLVLSRVVTVAMFGGALLATGKDIRIRAPGVMRFVVLLGFSNLVLNWLGNQGMQWTSASTASMLFKTDVLFTMVLGWLILGERVRWSQIPLVGVALAGCALVMIGGKGGASARGEHAMLGNLFCVIFGLLLTLNAMLIRAKLTDLGKMQLSFWNSLYGLCFFSAAWFALAAAGSLDLKAEFRTLAARPKLIGVLAAAGAAAAVTFLTYYQAIWNLPVWVVRVVMLLSPAIALLMAMAALDERAGPAQLAGMALLLGGTAGVVVSSRDAPARLTPDKKIPA